MSNAKIAEQYAQMVKSTLKDSGTWVSDNLPQVSRSDRKAILKEYQKVFKYVDYDSTTGICKCSNTPIVRDKALKGTIAIWGHTGGDLGQPVDLSKVRLG